MRVERTDMMERLNLRMRAIEKLREAMDMYEDGEDLWIVTSLGWASTNGPSHRIDIVIREDTP